MPPNATVILFDDSRDYADTATEVLERSGHTVIRILSNIDELQKYLATDEAKRATVVVLDHIAPWNAGEEADDKGVGPAAELRVRQALGESVITIANTSKKKPGYGDHQNITKSSFDLADLITRIPAKER